MLPRVLLTLVLALSPYLSAFCEPESTFGSIVKDFGFQTYTIPTEDYYELKVFRVQKTKTFTTKKRTVLLMHGLLDSADSWALNTNYNMVQALIDEDWDVWLSNNRGNKYSCFNSHIDSDYKQFWQFSFEQMAQYDFPAMVKFITQTVNDKITIVAHSQGSTQTFAALSEDVDLQKRIEQILAVAPVAYMIGFDKDPSYYYYGSTHKFLHMLMFLGYYSFFDHPIISNFVIDKIIKLFCVTNTVICNFIIEHISDRDPKNLDHEQIEYFLKHFPGRASIQSMEHYAQMIAKEESELRKFDFGPKKNVEVYGSVFPPVYDLSRIDVPVYMYYGNNDLLSTGPNVAKLESVLRHQKTRYYDDWGHWSYFVAKEVDRFIKDVVNDIKEEPRNIL